MLGVDFRRPRILAVTFAAVEALGLAVVVPPQRGRRAPGRGGAGSCVSCDAVGHVEWYKRGVEATVVDWGRGLKLR